MDAYRTRTIIDSPEQLDALALVAELNDPRIVPARVHYIDPYTRIVDVKILDHYQDLKVNWHLLTYDEIVPWCENLFNDLLKVGIVANDIHCENIMVHPVTKDIKLVDFEQFIPYTEIDEIAYRRHMERRIHKVAKHVYKKSDL